MKRHADGMLVRGKDDNDVVMAVHRDYALELLRSDDVVLDVGACFGAFSFLALKQGVRKVVAVEAGDYNWPILKHNLGGLPNAVVHCAAAYARFERGEVATVAFQYPQANHTMGTTRPGTMPLHNVREIRVPAIAIEDLFDEHEPTVLKMDCEGGEYEMLVEEILPDSVRFIACELHFRSNATRLDALGIWEMLKRLGFRIVRGPTEIPAANRRTVTNVWLKEE